MNLADGAVVALAAWWVLLHLGAWQALVHGSLERFGFGRIMGGMAVAGVGVTVWTVLMLH